MFSKIKELILGTMEIKNRKYLFRNTKLLPESDRRGHPESGLTCKTILQGKFHAARPCSTTWVIVMIKVISTATEVMLT